MSGVVAETCDDVVVLFRGNVKETGTVAQVIVSPTDALRLSSIPADFTGALLANGRNMPVPPEDPMSADRVRWEHIQRVYHQYGCNVSETARRLNMHRRTLQRILAKRSPR